MFESNSVKAGIYTVENGEDGYSISTYNMFPDSLERREGKYSYLGNDKEREKAVRKNKKQKWKRTYRQPGSRWRRLST